MMLAADEPLRRLRWAALLAIGFCGAYQIALGIYFIAFRPPLLPEDLRFLGIGPATLAILPRLRPWLHLVFVVFGGQAVAVGVLVIGAALRLRRRDTGGWLGVFLLGVGGVFSVGLMSVANFALGSDSRWLLTLPPIIWACGLILAVLNHVTAGGARSTGGKDAE